jgi:ABC-2 type transport system permease protein
MGFLAPISAAPNGLLARALSVFPLTSAVTMMLRLASGEEPAIDVAITIAIGVAAIYGLRAASLLFRVATLMYGLRPTLPALIRVLRSA